MAEEKTRPLEKVFAKHRVTGEYLTNDRGWDPVITIWPGRFGRDYQIHTEHAYFKAPKEYFLNSQAVKPKDAGGPEQAHKAKAASAPKAESLPEGWK